MDTASSPAPPGDRRTRQGHPRRRRVERHDQEALRLDRRRVDGGEPPRLPRAAVHRRRASSDHISGVILFDETIRQSSRRRHAVPEAAGRPGDHPRHQGRHRREAARRRRRARRSPRGSTACASASPSTTSSAPASRSGAPRTRSPTSCRRCYCIDVNAHALARYAALCQEAGIVPIVEPEVLMDGTHTIERSRRRDGRRARGAVPTRCTSSGVLLEGTLLKPNMVLLRLRRPSSRRPTTRSRRATVAHVPLRPCPAAVPGIVFLSGGQTDEQATARLNAMNQLGPHPWQLSFSYGRALQAPALKAWKGETVERRAPPRARSPTAPSSTAPPPPGPTRRHGEGGVASAPSM